MATGKDISAPAVDVLNENPTLTLSGKNVKILIYSPTENWPKVNFEPDFIWFLDPPDAISVLSLIDLPFDRIAENFLKLSHFLEFSLGEDFATFSLCK